MILYYRNSFIASIISLFGCALACFGIMDNWNIGLILAAIPFLIGGKLYSNHVAFRKWWKQVEKANLVPEISRSVDTAVAVYKKNPTKQTLSKIRTLNPQAAAHIERALQK